MSSRREHVPHEAFSKETIEALQERLASLGEPSTEAQKLALAELRRVLADPVERLKLQGAGDQFSEAENAILRDLDRVLGD